MSPPPNLPGDQDLAAALPEPPQPRPAARRTAIEAALRRFDGDGSATGGVAPAPRPRWIGRPQVAALATIALVLALGVPTWIAQRERFAPTSEQASRPLPADRFEQPAFDAAPVPEAPAPEAVIIADNAETASGAEREAASAAAAQASAKAAAEAPAPAAARQAEPLEVARDYADTSFAPSPPPPPPADTFAEAVNDIVVTSGRASALSRAERRATERSKAAAGDWTGCTVDDPNRSLDRCGGVADPAATGRAGRAAARQADGLLLAWRGDYDGAIKAFGEAIDIAPLPIAYLNRGLAYRRKGDLKRALADAERAIRAAPSQARGYRIRSMFRREQGDLRGAEADAERAEELDGDDR